MASFNQNDKKTPLVRWLQEQHEKLNHRRQMILQKRIELDSELSGVDAEDNQLCEFVANLSTSYERGGEPAGRFSRLLQAARLVVVVSCLACGAAFADDVPKAEGKAPPDHAVLKHTRGGVYFVAKPLKEKYDQLLGRVNLLKAEIEQGRISGAEARQQLIELQAQLETLRARIEETKVLVAAAKVKTQSETTSFELGRERLLVITADNVRVEGWDRPHVKCVLEKTVLSPDDKPVDDHFKGMKLVHRHRRAPDLVGDTRQELEAKEQEFLSSPKGKSLSAEHRESRNRLLRGILESYAIYREFQGKEIDALEIEGLTYEQGNRQIMVEASSEGGGASFGSDWQRHAALTVYVPACKAVALRGCLVRLEVEGLNAALIVTSAGSRDRDYDGVFQIKNQHGSLAIANVPIQVLENIQGNVSVTCTVDFANGGTQHENDVRRIYMPPPHKCVCKIIDGNLAAWFCRMDLRLEDIAGKVDINNEFGDTTLIVQKPLAEKSHRIISESGRIEVSLTQKALGDLPLLALSNCGTVRTNISRDVLEDTYFTVGQDLEFGSRNWHGVRTKRDPGDTAGFMDDFNRPVKVLKGLDRPPGFDLISRSGTVIVMADR